MHCGFKRIHRVQAQREFLLHAFKQHVLPICHVMYFIKRSFCLGWLMVHMNIFHWVGTWYMISAFCLLCSWFNVLIADQFYTIDIRIKIEGVSAPQQNHGILNGLRHTIIRVSRQTNERKNIKCNDAAKSFFYHCINREEFEIKERKTRISANIKMPW